MRGWFPAFVPARSHARVRGTLCELVLQMGELALLDRYEGAEYRRLTVPILTAGGSRGTAQLYLWRVALPRGTRPIRSGDLLGWLRDNRLSAFCPPHDEAGADPSGLAFRSARLRVGKACGSTCRYRGSPIRY